VAFLTRPIFVIVVAGAAWVILGPSIKALLRKSPATSQAGGPRRRWTLPGRLDHHTAVTLVAILIAAIATWTATSWNFDAMLMPLTASCAALLFGCLTLAQQMLTGSDPGAMSLAPHELGDAGGLKHSADLPARTLLLRALRFFLWLGGALGLATLIGLLPGLFVLMLLLTRLEFRESWRTSVILSVLMSVALWFVFGWIFETPWPLSVLGDYWPHLRAVTRIL